MKKSLKTEQEKAVPIKKRLFLTVFLTLLIVFSVSSFVLVPLYTFMYNDIAYSSTVLPTVIKAVIDILEVISYAVSFSSIIYSIYRFNTKGTAKLYITYAVAVLVKYIANILITVFDGTFDSSDIIYVILYFTFDMIILLSVSAFTSHFIRNFYEQFSQAQKANRILNNKIENVRDALFSQRKFYCKGNPLHKSALATGIILSVFKILLRIRLDVAIGAPASFADLMWMITYYLSDILIALIIYSISIYVFAVLDSKDIYEEQ